jgi:hypothetical protein
MAECNQIVAACVLDGFQVAEPCMSDQEKPFGRSVDTLKARSSATPYHSAGSSAAYSS